MALYLYQKIRNKIIVTVRYFVLDLGEKLPIIGRPLVMLWNAFCDLKFIVVRQILKLKSRIEYKTDRLDFNKVCWVNPQKIEYILNESFDIWKNHGKVIDGNWDKNIVKFEDLDVFKAFRQRFEQNKEWKHTDFYSRVLTQLERGKRKWGCKNKYDFDERLKKIDLLFDEIKRKGFKQMQELYGQEGIKAKLEKPSAVIDDVSVVIARDGRLLFVNGRHRFSIAKILKLPKIPVRIIARHKKWMDFRRELIAFSKNYQRGRLYQLLNHPDLQDILFRRGDFRYQIIKNNLSFSKGTLLDIGANLGYFCHVFEEEGLECHALEENRMCLYFMKKLRDAEGKKFKIIPESIFEYKKDKEVTFDVVLALSIFHHFLEREDVYLNFIKLLKRIKAKELFFEPHRPGELTKKNPYKDFTPEEFVNFIINNSCLNKAKFIGKAENGRPLYKLTV